MSGSRRRPREESRAGCRAPPRARRPLRRPGRSRDRARAALPSRTRRRGRRTGSRARPRPARRPTRAPPSSCRPFPSPSGRPARRRWASPVAPSRACPPVSGRAPSRSPHSPDLELDLSLTNAGSYREGASETALPHGAIRQMEEHHITVRRTARYYTLGPVDGDVAEVWIVCHGFAQLAGRFMRHFTAIDDGTRLIVAPEALNRFYVEAVPGVHGPDSKVGATWMTREDR